MVEFKLPKITQDLGDTIPYGDTHAISVVLPDWNATIGWATRDEDVLGKMETGYPRFFIHRAIDVLSEEILKRLRRHDYRELKAMLFPYHGHATLCRSYLQSQANGMSKDRIETLELSDIGVLGDKNLPRGLPEGHQGVSVVIYPADMFPLAKAFWQHTGFGISSRRAQSIQGWLGSSNPTPVGINFHSHNHREKTSKDILKQRIADLVSRGCADDKSMPKLNSQDVYLFPSGMAAISATAETIRMIKKDDVPNVVVYGFLYLDTFKVLSKIYGFRTTLYGHSTTNELNELESKLKLGYQVSALYCEFPGNPLLLAPNMLRIRSLADRYNFLVICDDTIGTFVNVDILPLVDILCTSLTKMFSGGCNVMGGSLVLNPHGKHHEALHTAMEQSFTDTYFPADAAIMEQNSRNFPARMARANANAFKMVSLLQCCPAVEQVYYPTNSTTLPLYDAHKRKNGGYGYLLSVIFVKPVFAQRFFDNLDVAKGPSLGTNFTLACPYTLFAHYGEREWASEYGVVEDLVRISVGLEDWDLLEKKVQYALDAIGEVEAAQ